MLTKLAFKNAGKSIRDYAVYFFTLVLGVSIFYMFNSIYAQQEMMVVTETINKSMVALREVLSLISVFVAIVLGFLIVYANNFFIKRRKKELGIYMSLGMDKTNISLVLVLETTIMAIIALIIGLVFGVFGSQFMSVFTASLFEADMTGFKFVFSLDAMIKSIVYFVIIFAVVILFNVVTIKRYKLIDLIYGGRKNEQLKIRNIKVSVVVFIIAVVCLVSAYYIILKNGIININSAFYISIALGVIGTFLFFFAFSTILVKLIQSKKQIYFKNLNMFVTRQLSSKINTNFVSVSVVCIVLFLVVGIFSSGYSLQNVFSNELKVDASYDFSLYGGDETETSIYDSLPEEVKSDDIIWHEYQIYNTGSTLHYSDFPVKYSSTIVDISNQNLNIILLSDYNKILEMLGKESINIADNEYLAVCSNSYFEDITDQFIQKGITLPLIDGVNLKPIDKIANTMISNKSGGVYFVVNDMYKEVINEMSINNLKIMNINCKNEEQANLIGTAIDMQYTSDEPISYYDFNSKAEIFENSVTTKVIVAFLAIYLGIVFMISCAAILAIQQLSEAADNKDRYELLHRLGAEQKMIEKALFTQVLCYFLMPLILAIVHSVVGLTVANEVINAFGKIDIMNNITVTALFIIGVYGIYFCLTYLGSKNIINKGE